MTINVLYYYEVLRTLKRCVNKKKPDQKNIWLLHHDNTKPHTTSIVREFLEKGKIEVLAHTMYSPALPHVILGIFEP